MTSILHTMVCLLTITLAACAGPKPPPAWPSGEERPINQSRVAKVVP